MIIPKQFLKTLKRTGLGDALFHTLRKDPATGELVPEFVLNRKPYNQAKILVVTGENFGCGSSREHAPWSLNDFGIRAIIAPSFAEIFKTNTMQNGMLPIVLSKDSCDLLASHAEKEEELEVDLEHQVVRVVNDPSIEIPFQVDSFRKHCLLNGLDDIGLTMQQEEKIKSFEERRSHVWPWLDGLGYKGKGGVIHIADAAKEKKKKLDW